MNKQPFENFKDLAKAIESVGNKITPTNWNKLLHEINKISEIAFLYKGDSFIRWYIPKNCLPDTSREVLSFIDEFPKIVYFDLYSGSFVYKGLNTDVECWADIDNPLHP